MIFDMKVAVKAIVAGAVGALLLILVNGFNYLLQDLLMKVLNVGYSLSSTISLWSNFFVYLLSIIVGLAVGVLAMWLCRTGIKSIKTMVIIPAVAGLTLGGLCLVARLGYELIIKPLLVGYSLNPQNALVTVLYSGTDLVMMIGLVLAGAAICAAFVVKTEIG